MKKYLLFFLLICSCVSYNSSPDLKTLPSWYVNQAQNNNINLFGVGEGFTLEEATRSALNNMAAKLAVTISSDASTLSEENKYSVNEEFRKKISEQVKAVSFNNYKVTNSIQSGNKFYVAVLVDRADFIKSQQQILIQTHENMKRLHDSASNQNILIRRSKLVEINNLAAKAALANEILQGLAANPDYQRNLKEYQFYQESYDHIFDNIQFMVKANDERIKDVIVEALNLQNLKVTNILSNNSNLVIIEVKSKVLVKNIYNSNMTNLQLRFKVTSDRGLILASNIIEVMGASVGGNDLSFNAAVKSFAKKVNSDGILKIIGVTNEQVL